MAWRRTPGPWGKPSLNTSIWNLRHLLRPVILRLHGYGADPSDLETVISRLANRPVLNARMFEERWQLEWKTLSEQWRQRSRAALDGGRPATAAACLFQASGCDLARFLVSMSDPERRREAYLDLATSHRDLAPTPIEDLEISCPGTGAIPAILHLPAGPGLHPCVAIFAGVGSCKEELHTFARALVERGVAAIACDMPGCGAALFGMGAPCSVGRIEDALKAVAGVARSHSELDASFLGAAGFGIGGGYAFHAAALDSRYHYVASLFPSFLDTLESGRMSPWMRLGARIDLPADDDADAIVASMAALSAGTPRVPVLVAQGRHGGGMNWDAAKALLSRVEHRQRDFVTIENDPEGENGGATIPVMPNGEQTSWVVSMAADWIVDRIRELRNHRLGGGIVQDGVEVLDSTVLGRNERPDRQ